jgi:hypothetical protein
MQRAGRAPERLEARAGARERQHRRVAHDVRRCRESAQVGKGAPCASERARWPVRTSCAASHAQHVHPASTRRTQRRRSRVRRAPFRFASRSASPASAATSPSSTPRENSWRACACVRACVVSGFARTAAAVVGKRTRLSASSCGRSGGRSAASARSAHPASGSPSSRTPRRSAADAARRHSAHTHAATASWRAGRRAKSSGSAAAGGGASAAAGAACCGAPAGAAGACMKTGAQEGER